MRALAAFPGRLPSFKVMLELAGLPSQLYEYLTYGPHAPRGCVKLQRQKHTERRTTDTK